MGGGGSLCANHLPTHHRLWVPLKNSDTMQTLVGGLWHSEMKARPTWSESLTVIFRPLRISPSGGCSYMVISNMFCGPFSPKNVGGWLLRSTTRITTVVKPKSKKSPSGLTSEAWWEREGKRETKQYDYSFCEMRVKTFNLQICCNNKHIQIHRAKSNMCTIHIFGIIARIVLRVMEYVYWLTVF